MTYTHTCPDCGTSKEISKGQASRIRNGLRSCCRRCRADREKLRRIALATRAAISIEAAA